MVQVGDDSLRVRVRGEGSPLVLLTGVGANLEMWAPFEDHLAGAGIMTIAVELPGNGETPAPTAPRRMPGLARLVESVLDELGHEQVDVLGVSFGGALALELVHQAPARVRRLILVSTAAGMPGLGGVPGSPRILASMLSPRRYEDPTYLARRAAAMYGGTAADHAMADALHAGSPPSRRGYLFQLAAIQFWTSVPWAWRIRQTTLVMSGDDDRVLPVINGRILARLIPHARLEVFSDAGHLFLLQRAQVAAASVVSFLAEDERRHSAVRRG